MRHVVFLRNVNQGQRGHPATADIVGALADAGFPDAAMYRSNGTAVVTGAVDAGSLADIEAALAARSGQDRTVLALPLAEVVRVAREHGGTDAGRRELTVHAGGQLDAEDPVLGAVAERWGCRVVATGTGWLVSSHLYDQGVSATPAVEEVTGSPASSRGMRTIVGLADRFGDDED